MMEQKWTVWALYGWKRQEGKVRAGRSRRRQDGAGRDRIESEEAGWSRKRQDRGYWVENRKLVKEDKDRGFRI